MDEHEALKRLADHVIARRTFLGMSRQAALAKRAGISERTVAELERGKPVSKNSLAAIERALKWEPSSCRAIMNGGTATPTGQEELPPPLQRIMDDPDLTWDEKRGAVALLRGMRDGWRKSA